MRLLLSDLRKYAIKKAVRAWGSIRKYAVPTAFAALFYFVSFFLGNRTICIFKATYGVPCPTCGMTRAFLHLSKGHVREALFYHPLFILPGIVFFVIVFRRNLRISSIYNSNAFWIITFLIFMIVWAIRMVFLFPYRPPLDFNGYGLFPVIFRFIARFI